MAEQDSRNEVILCGRLAAPADERELPSGDSVLTARLIVDRDVSESGKSRQRVDTIDCVAWQSRIQRTMPSWLPGDVVRVDGSLRRRFYGGPAGAISRTEVEVKKAKRLRKHKDPGGDESMVTRRRRTGSRRQSDA